MTLRTTEEHAGLDDGRVYSLGVCRTPVSESNDLIAALDLGTNSCRMIIARPNGRDIQIVDAFSRTVYLGNGLERHGSLSRAAMSRALSALHVCREKLRSHRVSRSRLVATEACRRASNGACFVERVKMETGLSLEIIDPEEESRLAVVGCAPHVAEDTDALLVVDIGGGSTELVWIDLSECSGDERFDAILRLQFGRNRVDRLRQGFAAADSSPARVIDWISIPLGVATLDARYADVVGLGPRYALMSCHFEEHLDLLESSVGSLAAGRFQVIGTSGTVTTIAASHLGLKRYDRNKVNGLNMRACEIGTVVDRYIRQSYERDRNSVGQGRRRMNLVMSGAAILQAILRVWPAERFTAADCGLREGLLYSQMIAADAQGQNRAD